MMRSWMESPSDGEPPQERSSLDEEAAWGMLFNCTARLLQMRGVSIPVNSSASLRGWRGEDVDGVEEKLMQDAIYECLLPSSPSISPLYPLFAPKTTAHPAGGPWGSRRPFTLPSWQKASWIFVFSVMLLVAAPGNAIVIWIVLGHRRMRTATNCFLVNLSVSDLLLSLLNCAFNLVFMLDGDWPFGGAYCSLSNFVANCSVAASVFSLTAISVDRIRTLPNPKLLDPITVRSELKKALDVWADNSRLTFQMVDHDDADINIEFSRGYHGDNHPFDGKGNHLAHAYFPGTGRGGDAHFDDDELWVGPNSTIEEGTRLFYVAAHEFGHSLGLNHSSVREALMYKVYEGNRNKEENFRLPDDDRYGIEQLYGRKHERPYPTRGPGTTPSTTTTTLPPPRYTPPTRRPPPDRPSSDRPHQRPERPPHTKPLTEDYKPDSCDTSYDAISLIRGELFIFKGRYMWRLYKEQMMDGHAVEITRLWQELPSNLTQIDAVYERPDNNIVFFIGKQYFLFNGTVMVVGYPKPLTHLGLPESLEKIDGAMVWGHNSKTYFFSGTMYWRLEDHTNKVELDYPQDMKMWRGVGYNIDCVFRDNDGITYFFKDKGFWKFNDRRMRVDKEGQLSSAFYWMHCPVE